MKARTAVGAAALITFATTGCLPQLVRSGVGVRTGTIWVTDAAGGDSSTGRVRAAISCNGPTSGRVMYGPYVNVNDGQPLYTSNGQDIWISTAGPCNNDEGVGSVWMAP